MSTLREAAQMVLDAYDEQHRWLELAHLMTALRAALDAEPTPAPPQTPMTDEEVLKVLNNADWPQSLVSDFITSKLVAAVRATERHHGIGPARGG
ncbi:MAG: hypothetical protein MUC42_07425 [Bryobacter sp.]|jgi:hypothetical protein|nr:hypothetical protein [Bryobacter sp.]